ERPTYKTKLTTIEINTIFLVFAFIVHPPAKFWFDVVPDLSSGSSLVIWKFTPPPVSDSTLKDKVYSKKQKLSNERDW
ncbi:hypothetical protein LM595_01225, partial [Candidatus Acetothermia bacterium]|nr:hypothetical protein [Candidatus Acetothermia bacterium]